MTSVDNNPSHSVSDLSGSVRRQVEYYFSTQNLSRDSYLISQMSPDGWVPLSLIARFKMVRNLTHDISLVEKSLVGSSVVELSSSKNKNKNGGKNGDENNEETVVKVRAVDRPRLAAVSLRGMDPNATTRDIGNALSEGGFSTDVLIRDATGVWHVTLADEAAAEKCREAVISKGVLDKLAGGSAPVCHVAFETSPQLYYQGQMRMLHPQMVAGPPQMHAAMHAIPQMQMRHPQQQQGAGVPFVQQTGGVMTPPLASPTSVEGDASNGNGSKGGDGTQQQVMQGMPAGTIPQQPFPRPGEQPVVFYGYDGLYVDPSTFPEGIVLPQGGGPMMYSSDIIGGGPQGGMSGGAPPHLQNPHQHHQHHHQGQQQQQQQQQMGHHNNNGSNNGNGSNNNGGNTANNGNGNNGNGHKNQKHPRGGAGNSGNNGNKGGQNGPNKQGGQAGKGKGGSAGNGSSGSQSQAAGASSAAANSNAQQQPSSSSKSGGRGNKSSHGNSGRNPPRGSGFGHKGKAKVVVVSHEPLPLGSGDHFPPLPSSAKGDGPGDAVFDTAAGSSTTSTPSVPTGSRRRSSTGGRRSSRRSTVGYHSDFVMYSKDEMLDIVRETLNEEGGQELNRPEAISHAEDGIASVVILSEPIRTLELDKDRPNENEDEEFDPRWSRRSSRMSTDGTPYRSRGPSLARSPSQQGSGSAAGGRPPRSPNPPKGANTVTVETVQAEPFVRASDKPETIPVDPPAAAPAADSTRDGKAMSWAQVIKK